MKKLLFFVLFGFVTMSGRAQVRVAPMTDSVDYKTFHREYTQVVNQKQPLTSLDLTFQKLMSDYWTDFNRFLKQKNFRPIASFYMSTETFFRADGRADLLLYQYVNPDQRPPATVEDTFLKLLSTYLAERRLPVRSSLILAPFRVGGGINIMPPAKRITPRGAGVIGDLATATQTTRPDTVKSVLFRNLDLEKVPDIIYRFVNAEEIDLGNNYLTALPARLTAMPKLQRLNLMSNRLPNDSVFFARNKSVKSINIQKNSLTRVPSYLRQNRRLESLWLGNNDFSQLADNSFRGLRRLNDLNLYSAGLTQLPKSIGKLKRLTVLDMYYNHLTTLPKQLNRLKRLDQLALAYNDLSELPASMSKLRRLRTLFVHHNKLGTLPGQFSKLTNLHVVDLSYNGLTMVPPVLGIMPSLEELNLNNNNLRDFPPMLLSIKNLKRVNMGSNPLFGQEAMDSPYAPMIKQLEANKTQVTY